MRCVLMLCVVSAAYGQLPHSIYVGIKGGTPLTTSTTTRDVSGRSGVGMGTASIRRYAVGPSVEVAIPFGLRIEADALYRRFDNTEHRYFSPTFGRITRLQANIWEFPMMLKYAWGDGARRPFVAAGGTFRYVRGFDGSTETFAGGFTPPYDLQRYRVEESVTQGGVVVGAGLRVGTVWSLQVTPEIRYTRWTSLRFIDVRNEVEFLIGIGR